MGGPADAIEDHPGQGQVRVEGSEPMDQGRGAPGHGPGVHHQEGRQPQPLGHLGRGTGFACAVIAVEQAHNPLHHGHLGLGGVAPEQGQVGLPAQHPAVQRAGAAAGGPAMVPRVNEVGTHLEGLHRQAAAPQGREQPQGDGGLAHAALGAGDHQAAAAHHLWSSQASGWRKRANCSTAAAERGPGCEKRPSSTSSTRRAFTARSSLK